MCLQQGERDATLLLLPAAAAAVWCGCCICCLVRLLLHPRCCHSLVYPLRLRAPKGTALVVWAMAAAFCCCNGYMQVGGVGSRPGQLCDMQGE